MRAMMKTQGFAKGFYDYEKGKRVGPSKQAYELLGVAPREASPIPPDLVSDRLLLPMINEAAHCLAEEVVASAARVDLAMIFGTGFPPFRGGLMRHADSLGAASGDAVSWACILMSCSRR